MKNLPSISSYEIKSSRTNQLVPIVNGVYLHSIYNPFKEAQKLIDDHLRAIEQKEQKNEILVLGLGFGYHINYLIERLAEIHGDNFRIVVIEPNHQVYQDCIANNLLNKKNVIVYSGFSDKELYKDLDLIHFLLKKPSTLVHPASFNLYQLYFKKILTFEAPTSIEEVSEFLESHEIKHYLKSFSGETKFSNALVEQIEQKETFSSMDFAALALFEMTKKSELQSEEISEK